MLLHIETEFDYCHFPGSPVVKLKARVYLPRSFDDLLDATKPTYGDKAFPSDKYMKCGRLQEVGWTFKPLCLLL